MPESAEFRKLTVAPAELFQDNLVHHTEREAYFAGRHRLVALVRLALFGAAAAGLWGLLSAGQTAAALGLGLAAYLVFIGLVGWHNRVGYHREHHRLLAQLNEGEQARLAGQLQGFDPGRRYLDAQHPYAADLDVFGDHSLFQLLNRSTSRLGQDWLAGWLLAPAAPEAARERQQATAELAPAVAWQQEWQARARHYPRQETDPRAFAGWLREPDFFAGRGWLLPLLGLLPLLAVVGVAAPLLGYGTWFLLLLAPSFALNHHVAGVRAAYYAHATTMRDALRAAHDQLAHFEAGNWQSPALRRLHRTLHDTGNTAAARLLNRLTGIAGWFSARQNPAVAGVLNTLLLWDLWGIWQLERWKRRITGGLEPLLEAAAEIDALVSLAAFRAANPGCTEPDLTAPALTVEATQLAHPLLFGGEGVRNDFQTAGLGQTVIVTGSNMAGKSTFLRTVGLNLVLAQAGAVVAANAFRCGPAQVFTAMRTHDNLAESTSSFYAELKRLRLLLDLTSGGELKNKSSTLKMAGGVDSPSAFTTSPATDNPQPATNKQQPVTEIPVFYLLDEILKGTNSEDRHRGARALVFQLRERVASGLISTHDLELAALETDLPGHVCNVSFNSYLNPDGTLRFDYRLTPGVCRSFNASQLMRLMGIVVE
ncbi:MutS-related protein [Hymenobacter rubripertinctus]|uniref:DNA mismatch repair protein MutS n=1 Tax=Hymenobacter rubripertinctus TaxID=2029981 RepID=A0A418RA43_9BACT|nr:DNA mismatch repair protein MutS [Hymenobacter rubripertinctus]RIY14144.1 DNA mismatch repair protein MutS [Hymenobacter rubripertinctus]